MFEMLSGDEYTGLGFETGNDVEYVEGDAIKEGGDVLLSSSWGDGSLTWLDGDEEQLMGLSCCTG
jgi:hypothetical protein